MLTKRWIICEDQHDDLVPVEITVDETEKTIRVFEKHNNKETWRMIASCLRYRTRLSKNDHRLFNSKQEAIEKTIESLQAARESLSRKVQEATDKIAKLQEILGS
jgi:peptidoglycan hydrolase CwlO-like protein